MTPSSETVRQRVERARLLRARVVGRALDDDDRTEALAVDDDDRASRRPADEPDVLARQADERVGRDDA